MTDVRIFQKAKNAMQSGRRGTDQWQLEFIARDAQQPDPLMGWAGSRDTRRQLNLTFPSLEAAQAYAREKGLTATVIPPPRHVLKIQAYADNFR